MAIDLQKINLRKEMVFNLTKAAGIENQKAQVVLCMDYSGSMADMYASGKVQEVIERLVPIALQFDDNGELDLYLFSNHCQKHPRTVTLKNLDNFIRNEVTGKYQFGGTNYAPPIQMIQQEAVGSVGVKKGWFGSSKPEAKKIKYPVYVIFITDGENGDRGDAEQAIREASNYGIFFQFVGIGSASFPFLEKLDNLSGRFIDNANFFKVPDLNRTTDQELYGKLLGEFPSWLKIAKQKNIIE